MHYRQRIRETLAIRLAAAETLAGPNVFTSRARPILEILQKREAVLSVYTADETSARSPDGHLLTRSLTVSVEAAAGGGDDLDAILDHLAEQVEAAIDADPTLGGLLSDDLELTATTSEISARGNQQVGAFRMDFEAKYLTERGVDAALGPEPPTPTNITISGTLTDQQYSKNGGAFATVASGTTITFANGDTLAVRGTGMTAGESWTFTLKDQGRGTNLATYVITAS